ncbi:unnamed protein product [Cylindrotheca closterium]|uniref:Translation initiation factor eIF2B subunit beta n=1 Tax=Cylindrotheca closterium TaxID=2856 RepID=A0AAD2FNI6_9STRA|nr:unnamed protein product [Cylindrotheca closterium]
MLSDPLAVRPWLFKNHPKQLALLDKFEVELKLGRLSGVSSEPGAKGESLKSIDRRTVAFRTVEILKTMIGSTRWQTPAHLVALLRGLGRELHSAGGFREPAIGNVVRRIIAAVREEAVMEAITEFTSDLEDLHKNINDQATDHIHAGEIVLTYGRSKTVESFLKAAADKRLKFTVVVCESAPKYEGSEMAKSLADCGIDTCVIPDSAIFCIMARVNKVLLPAHAVLANGGLIAPSGSNMVVLSASQNSVPVICLTGMFKLTPIFPHEGQDTLNDMLCPSSVVSMHDKKLTLNNVDLVNPIYDYVRPELINLYVTNVGSFQPSYIYRLLAEYYHNDDWSSFE